MKISIVNGPNINILEKRKSYGGQTLKDIEKLCLHTAKTLGLSLEFFQSNHEGEIVEFIQTLVSDGVVINAAAYTHTSIAILDALLVLDVPIVEVHISNIFARENFRKHSYISQVARSVIAGTGIQGYCFALEYLRGLLLK